MDDYKKAIGRWYQRGSSEIMLVIKVASYDGWYKVMKVRDDGDKVSIAESSKMIHIFTREFDDGLIKPIEDDVAMGFLQKVIGKMRG